MTATMPDPSASARRHLRAEVLAYGGYTPGEQATGCVKLNTNECAWPPSPRVREVLRGVADDTMRLYPDPRANRLREVAAGVFGVPSRDWILAGNGSDDCLTVLYRSVLKPADRVAVPWPTYGLYDDLATLQGAEIVHVDFRQAPHTWHLPTVLARQNAKLVLVANPNNPSATLVPVDDLRRLADQLDGLLVVDEAYVDFALTENPAASVLPHLAAHPNLVVLRTFSKSYSLAGGRLGLLFAAPALISAFMKVKDSYNVNALTQLIGIAALEDRDQFHANMRRTIAERARLEGALSAFGWTWPKSAANFLLCDVGERAGDICRELKERGYLVRWWNRPGLSTKLRITVGRPEDTDALIGHLRALGC